MRTWCEVFRMIQGAQWALGFASHSDNPKHPGHGYANAPFDTNWKVTA